MTELSTSKIKVKDGKRLFFNKFSYKVHLVSNELYYSYWASNITEFRQKIDERLQDQLERKSFYESYRKKIDPNKIDYETVENYLNFRDKYKKDKNLVTFRREGDGVGIYSNEISILNEVLAFSPTSQVTQIIPMPAGIMYFKKDPPAAFRVFCKSGTFTNQVRQDLIEYLERTPDLVPNTPLERAFFSHRHSNMYVYEGHYFNYNDDRNILMMHLMFPGLLGKSYKLEKK